ncbi:MFS transporter [Pantoea ananatis]
MTNSTSAPRRRHWILFACMLAMFMAAIEVTIVATAMPTIVADLGGFSQFGWVFCLSPYPGGERAALWQAGGPVGPQKMLFLGIAIFLTGSVLCGFAHTMLWLIVFRAFQGLGAGAIMPLSSTIVADIYSPRERASVQGWLSSVWGVAAIVGPLSGAWLVQHFSWSVIFWVNVPIGIISMRDAGSLAACLYADTTLPVFESDRERLAHVVYQRRSDCARCRRNSLATGCCCS